MADRAPASILGLCALLLVSCGRPAPAVEAGARTGEPGTPATTATVWPSGLRVLGDGYPDPGDPCRRVGESELTVDLLDDSAVLVGCPGSATDAPAAAIVSTLGGRIVGSAGGPSDAVVLISVPQRDANAGMAASGGPAPRASRQAGLKP